MMLNDKIKTNKEFNTTVYINNLLERVFKLFKQPTAPNGQVIGATLSANMFLKGVLASGIYVPKSDIEECKHELAIIAIEALEALKATGANVDEELDKIIKSRY
jgi:hypothetical protein